MKSLIQKSNKVLNNTLKIVIAIALITLSAIIYDQLFGNSARIRKLNQELTQIDIDEIQQLSALERKGELREDGKKRLEELKECLKIKQQKGTLFCQ